MRVHLDGHLKTDGKQYSATEWDLFLPVAEFSPDGDALLQRTAKALGGYRAWERDKLIDGEPHHCWYFGRHEDEALCRAWAFVQKIC